jgi:hypothetical protein
LSENAQVYSLCRSTADGFMVAKQQLENAKKQLCTAAALSGVGIVCGRLANPERKINHA